MTSARKLTPRIFIGLVFSLFLAALAFSQASASIGLSLASFRPLGGGFFSERSGHLRLALQVLDPKQKVSAKTLLTAGRNSLLNAPLTPRSLWLVGEGMKQQGNMAKARRAMEQAHRVSRRDSAVELWLGQDRLRQGRIEQGIQHYDLMLRGNAEASADIMPRLALVLMSREGRHYLSPYVREDNPWVLSLLQAAGSNLPRSAPFAQLLVNLKNKVPDVPNVRPVYAQLISKLISERQFKLALQLYPRLPGAQSSSLTNVMVGGDGRTGGYPPFTWDFVYSDERDAAIVGLGGKSVGIEFSGSPGTVGIAASKLIAPRGPQNFRWMVVDKTPNIQATANWQLTCLVGTSAGKSSRSVDLFAESVPLEKPMQMAIPSGCELYRLDMRVAGGIGRNPAALTVGGLTMVPSVTNK